MPARGGRRTAPETSLRKGAPGRPISDVNDKHRMVKNEDATCPSSMSFAFMSSPPRSLSEGLRSRGQSRRKIRLLLTYSLPFSFFFIAWFIPCLPSVT
eukprot:2781928-Rhodomonas_salina.1